MAKRDSDLMLLGATLKKLRENAGLSQLDLAIQMGWNGNSPVNEIEHGKRHPKPSTIEKWIDCVNGSYPALYYCLGIAKAIPVVSENKIPGLQGAV
jgi:transcriptional regulator with XRE-family HTH domain